MFKKSQRVGIHEVLVNPTTTELFSFAAKIKEHGIKINWTNYIKGAITEDGDAVFGDGYVYTHADLANKAKRTFGEDLETCRVTIQFKQDIKLDCYIDYDESESDIVGKNPTFKLLMDRYSKINFNELV